MNKTHHTVLAIRNAGVSANMIAITLNKLFGMRTVKRLVSRTTHSRDR